MPNRHGRSAGPTSKEKNRHQQEGQGVVHLVPDRRLEDGQVFRWQPPLEGVGSKSPQGDSQKAEKAPQASQDTNGTSLYAVPFISWESDPGATCSVVRIPGHCATDSASGHGPATGRPLARPA